ncbi:probable receptor-like protein kinase At1g49730 isoform X1 [Prosopis cineraria]|uniref:probable receptor-like protein kinase At1g49730 isoform X1 n=1 Tax=Prosopis cineraria TaxID=364024 RepID=UPI00240F2BCD|nr:probable receptor-like protein kinase At1g49730 isoform X1 [Prosopis cineraria]
MFGKLAFYFELLAFLGMQLPLTMADCPLDFTGSNFTLASSMCSNQFERGKCCRYINANIAVSVARFANVTRSLGVTLNASDPCLQTISQTLQHYGVPHNATIFCGFGTKISVNYECEGRTTVMQMLQSPRFVQVVENCKVPLAEESKCKKCLNAGINFIHHLIGIKDNITLSTCRDATFAALASQVDEMSTIDIASCFFRVQGLLKPRVIVPSPSLPTPEASPSPVVADSPSQSLLGAPLQGKHRSYHLAIIPAIGIAITAIAAIMLLVLVVLIRQKRKELVGTDNFNKTPSSAMWKFQEGPSSMFRKFNYREIKKATEDFNTIIGQGGFGTVYKAHFRDDLVLAVKRMNKVSEQGEDEFCKEIELLARLHHRHLVALRGFCVKNHERFLMYEYMENGSLKDHLHSPSKAPLSWRTRIQVAIDVANALEYLHFYCDPPLWHRDIKSSNILLDENFVAKLADFGLAHASKNGSISFEAVNTNIMGTPGYMDPEYVVTHELTEKSDIYNYGVLLLEIVTGRRAIQDNKNLVEWAQPYMGPDSVTRLMELVDPNVRESFDLDQLQTAVSIVEWCTQREGRIRPSIKQVLRLLYDTSEPMHSGFLQDIEGEECEGNQQSGRSSRGKMHRNEALFQSKDGRYLASSSSTSRSYCSKSFLLETSSPQSPLNILSVEDKYH